jgi:hypothetical protein
MHDCALIEKRFLQKCQVYLPNCAKKLLLELLLKFGVELPLIRGNQRMFMQY